MTVSNYNLPSKFFPFLLGHPSCTSNDIKEEIEHNLSLKANIKNNVLDCGKWILKYPRTDGLATTPDTHLYRVRKAEKIRNYIINNKLEAEFAVPKKFLYQLENKDYCVVAEKLELSQEVVSFFSNDTREAIMNVPELERQGQGLALTNGAKERPLTPTQAKALAELSILGYTDQTFNNFFFTVDGKVAVLDTEPVKRWLKKTVTSNKIAQFLGDKSGTLTCQSLGGIAKLKQFCTDPEARKQVELVEKNHVLWAIAKLTLKVALVSLVIYAIPRAISSLGLPNRVETLLRVSLRTVFVIKTILLAMHIVSVSTMWIMSCSGDKGLAAIGNIEKNNGC